MEEEYSFDLSKRTPNEWAKIYSIKLYTKLPMILWSEFEWCYNMPLLDYMYIERENDEGEYAQEMELRALEIKNMIFHLAEETEKMLLKEKYIETEWIKKKLLIA